MYIGDAIFCLALLPMGGYNGAAEGEVVEDPTILAEIPSSLQLLSVEHVRLDRICLLDYHYFDLICFHESRLFLKQGI